MSGLLLRETRVKAKLENWQKCHLWSQHLPHMKPNLWSEILLAFLSCWVVWIPQQFFKTTTRSKGTELSVCGEKSNKPHTRTWDLWGCRIKAKFKNYLLRQGGEVTSTSTTGQIELQRNIWLVELSVKELAKLSSKIPRDTNRVRISLPIYRSSRCSRT